MRRSKPIWIGASLAVTAVAVAIGVRGTDRTPAGNGPTNAEIQRLAELDESGERRVFVASTDAGLKLRLSTYYESAARDSVFQSAIAAQLGIPAGQTTVLVLEIINGQPPAAENGDANAPAAPSPSPVPLGDERVTVTLSDGRKFVSEPLTALAQAHGGQVPVILAAFSARGELPGGGAVRRYIAFPASFTIDRITDAKLRLGDDRRFDLAAETETYSVPPGLPKPPSNS